MNLAVASNLHTIAKHTVIAYNSIVANMGSFQKEVIITDNCTTISISTTIYHDIFTDDIIISDLHIRFSTSEIKILWQCRNHTTLMDLIVVANT